MRTLNKVMLLGSVGMNPEIRATGGGKTVVNFALATSLKLKGRNETVTEWHRLVAWGRTAEIVRDYVAKGSKLYVEGRLQTRKYDKDGVTHYATEIVVSDLSLLGSKAAERSNAAALNGGIGERDKAEIIDDDISF